MEILIDRGCGMDVHKKVIVVTIDGTDINKETRTYSTMTNDLLQLKDWLKENGITHVAMESTGIYWRPIFNILEDSFEVMVVNARHIKYVPGRKTDVRDSDWICTLLMRGLLSPSFIPPKDIRQLRDLTRYRKKLIQTKTAEKNRVQKVLEDANIKLSSVVTDTFGVSGSQMIEALVKGKLSVDEIVNMAKGRLVKKKKELKEALTGYMQDHHIFLLKVSFDHIKNLRRLIAKLESRIAKLLKKYRKEVRLLCTIPGIDKHGAASIIAEVGVDMSRYPTDHNLCSWAGMCPGNNESAGKKKSGKTTNGNKSLKTTLTECGWAASRTKGTYFKAKYYNLVGRRGKKRALVAVGHKLLISCYHILRYKVEYKELGIDYLDKKRKKNIIRRCLKKLDELGIDLKLQADAILQIM